MNRRELCGNFKINYSDKNLMDNLKYILLHYKFLNIFLFLLIINNLNHKNVSKYIIGLKCTKKIMTSATQSHGPREHEAFLNVGVYDKITTVGI